MPKKARKKRERTKKEIYSMLGRLETDIGKAQYFDQILSRKDLMAPKTYKAVQESADEIYGEIAMEAAREGRFTLAEELAEKIKDKKLANKIYSKMAVEVAEGGWFKDAGKLAREAENNRKRKFPDYMYGKAAVEVAEKSGGWFYNAEKFAERIKDEELVNDTYGKAAVEAVKKGRFGDAGEFAKKSEEYLKQNHPGILADIYEKTGKVIKAKDLRKRLERESKKK